MLSNISTLLVLAIGSMASLASAASCGGRGSFVVGEIHADLGDVTLGPTSNQIFQQGSGQICIVNRAPNTQVFLNKDQVNSAILTVLQDCCGSSFRCSGGQQKITAISGNVIDLSVQGLGQDCTA